MNRLPAAAFAALAGCLQSLPPVADEPLLVAVTDVATTPLEGVRWPTDLLPTADGGVVVLDGYHGRALRLDAAGAPTGQLGDPATWGRPVRVAPARPEGMWLVVGDEARLVRIDDAGAIRGEIDLGSGERRIAPTAVADTAAGLVVADRDGRVSWLADDGRVLRHLETDVDGLPFGVIVDLVPRPDGSLLAVDAGEGRVHTIGADGRAIGMFGHFGMWAGTLAKPKSAALGPTEGTVVVADSALGALQLYDEADVPLGLLAAGDQPIRLGHPIAVRRVGADRYLALDAEAGDLWSFRIGEEAVDAARRAAPVRRLRVPLQDPLPDVAGEHGELCVQCHDGMVNDHREVWDPDLSHHPVNLVVDRDLPEDLPLGEGHRLRCITCHTPHGAGMDTLHGPSDEASERDRFTRLTVSDSALCVACHGESPHDGALPEPAGLGGAHPSGEALVAALRSRGDRPDPGCLGCHDVHGAAQGSLGGPMTDSRQCLRCHAGRIAVGGGHQEIRRDRSPACLSCHDARGNALPCEGCHRPEGAGTAGTAPGVLGHPVGVRGADGDPLTCLTCHGEPHAPTVPAPDACRSCHGTQDADLARGGHGGATCLSCHPAHTAAPIAAAAPGVNPRSRPCLGCHGPGGDAPIAAHEHPALVFRPDGERWTPIGALPLYDAGGEQVPAGQNGDLACASCHLTHGPDAAGSDHLRRGGGQEACAACHGDEGLVVYRTFHSPDRRSSLRGDAGGAP